METNVSDNLKTVALIFSAIESARTRQPVYVESFLEKCQEQMAGPITAMTDVSE